MNMITIGKLAESAGVGVETLRFYQRKELLEIPEPTGKIRYYDDTHLRRITFIKSAQAAGFTLNEIKQLLRMDASQDHAKARELAMQRLAAIDKQVEELQNARTALEKLAHECEHSRDQPCPIIASFVEGQPL
ncbi:MerR family transcriptional regulator [Aliidiomarina sp. Khilg15.8]